MGFSVGILYWRSFGDLPESTDFTHSIGFAFIFSSLPSVLEIDLHVQSVIICISSALQSIVAPIVQQQRDDLSKSLDRLCSPVNKPRHVVRSTAKQNFSTQGSHMVPHYGTN